jgi:uncharacterized membrane protein
MIFHVIGVFLYYARAVDITMLIAFGSLALLQPYATTTTITHMTHLLDKTAAHHDETALYQAIPMILTVCSDASYLL